MKADKRKPLTLYVAVFAILALLLVVGGYMLERSATSSGPSGSKGKTVEEILGLGGAQEAPVSFNGKWYQRNKDVETYLLMGVDKEGIAQSSGSYNGGGQADVLLLLVLDPVQSAFQVLQINRDTMTEVEVLGVRGDIIGRETQQITLAHHYGDGLESSCENTVRAVSNLLYGIDIDGYAAIQMGALPVVNDMVGGVSVTIEDDFSQVDPTLVQGETIKLQGEQATHFIRSRYYVGDETNLSRMKRHRTYLHGFDQAFTAAAENDPELVLRIYDAVQDYLVTDMGSGTISRIAERCQKYQNNGIVTVDGEARLGEVFMEFYPDEEDLRQTVLNLFYKELSED